MMRLIAVALVTIAACACPSKATKTGGASGSADGSGSPIVTPPVGGCAAAQARIEQLYRAEAQAKEPKRVEEAVADNTAMAMAECQKAPDKVAACIAAAATAKDLDTTCMPQLDDEGSEGDSLKR
ncbi:MAG: hypothetical protein H0T46_04135 [Deltaproteobacteria bacterium]|nr:hypothetical protein [Deltaproteobacteria bacterium]